MSQNETAETREKTSHLSADELKAADKTKHQTGKSPERIMHETSAPFSTCFGLSAEMKALQSLYYPKGLTEYNDGIFFDEMCLQMAELRLELIKSGADRKSIPYSILTTILQKHFPSISLAFP